MIGVVYHRNWNSRKYIVFNACCKWILSAGTDLSCPLNYSTSRTADTINRSLRRANGTKHYLAFAPVAIMIMNQQRIDLNLTWKVHTLQITGPEQLLHHFRYRV